MSEHAPDLCWDALVEVCGYADAVTQTERGRINAALKELRAIYPSSTPYAISFDIRARADVYRHKFPGMVLTPQALVGNWSRLDPAEQAEREHAISAIDVPPPARCATCTGLRMVVVHVRADGSEEYAPCPDCHPAPQAAGWWRFDGSHHTVPAPPQIREALVKLLEADRGDT